MALTALTVFCLAALVTWLGNERSGVRLRHRGVWRRRYRAPPEASAQPLPPGLLPVADAERV